jgi:hypothetical protein
MQRKKKPNIQQAQKHLAVQYRADFFRKMKFIFDNLCGKDIFPLIPQWILDDAYKCRCAPFKFKAGTKSNISSKQLNNCKVILSNMFKKLNVQLQPNNLEITLSDYYTVFFTIVVLDSRLRDTTFENAYIVKEALRPIVNDSDTNEAANKQMYSALYTFNFGDSDLRKTLHWYKHEMIIPKTFPAETENVITIHSETPENITIEVDGISRPAIRVGWAIAYTGAEWLSLKPSDLGFKNSRADIPLKVYIQSHAINRLLERIDCFWTGNIQFNMYCSLAAPIIAHDNNNNLLIEFRLFDTKAGYFRADIVNDIILIRTFLFITNNGTPEGQLLEKNTGLQKLDKNYLAIDKLSSFMTSDLDKNEEVQHIFKTSGCQCLLDLYGKLKPMVTKHANGFDSELMLKYITNQYTDIVEMRSEAPLNT